MRIVSLMPSATEIVHALGLADQLVGRSDACDFPSDVLAVPALTRWQPDLRGHVLDRRALVALQPDLVLTDGSEDDPIVEYGELSDVVGSMPGGTTLVAIAPQSIEGVLNSIATVGAYTESEYEAVGLIELLRERLERIDSQRPVRPQRVVVIDRLEPLQAAGRWVPEMVQRAGGWEVLGRAGAPSETVSWERVREVDPDVLVLALREADAAAAEAALGQADLPAWFDDLTAVRGGGFFAVDGHGLFSRPGPRVIEGVAVLAELLEPEMHAGSGPVEAWRPLAPLGLAAPRDPDAAAG